MNKLKTFVYVVRNTFSSALYYRDVLKAPLSFSFKYFFSFFFVFAVLMTIFVAVALVSPVEQFVKLLPPTLIQSYPEELVVHIQNGEVATNVDEPYYISIQNVQEKYNELRKNVLGTASDTVRNVLVIDTHASIDDFARFQTVALLTKNHLTVRKEDGTLQSYSLAQIKDFTINRGLVNQWVTKLTPLLGYIYPLIVSSVFLGVLIGYTVYALLYCLFLGLVLFILSRAAHNPQTYEKCYQVGLHLVTISTVLFAVSSLLSLNLNVPFLQTAVLGFLGYFIFTRTRHAH